MLNDAHTVLSPANVSPSPVCRLTSTSGSLRTEHFLLRADLFELELDPGSFELLAARAEGHVEVRMVDGDKHVAFAENATYKAQGQRLVLDGWMGINRDGGFYSLQEDGREVALSSRSHQSAA